MKCCIGARETCGCGGRDTSITFAVALVQTGSSTMSDFDRNIVTSPFGRPLERRATVAVDHGLREYMLGIYNYMVIGLAITGFAALGIYMLSVTTDPAAAI